jgi:hypothetical protein
MVPMRDRWEFTLSQPLHAHDCGVIWARSDFGRPSTTAHRDRYVAHLAVTVISCPVSQVASDLAYPRPIRWPTSLAQMLKLASARAQTKKINGREFRHTISTPRAGPHGVAGQDRHVAVCVEPARDHGCALAEVEDAALRNLPAGETLHARPRSQVP